MNKLAIVVVLSFLLALAPAQAVWVSVNWADGGEDLRSYDQGADITFNYESFAFYHDVETEILLIDSRDPYNPVEVLIDRTDFEGHYGFKTFATDDLPQGTYAIFATATDKVTKLTSVDEIDFIINEIAIPINNAPYFVNLPDYFEYQLSDVSDTLFNIADYAVDPDGDELFFTLDTSSTNTDIVACNMRFESSLFCEFLSPGITTVDVVVSDGELTTRETVSIKVIDDTPINNAPYFLNIPTPFTYQLSQDEVTVLRLSDYAFDPDGDGLTFQVTGGNNIVSCNVQSDTDLFCDLLNPGTTTLTLQVSDGQFSDSEQITIIVEDDPVRNEPPKFTNLPTYFEFPLSLGSAQLVELPLYAYDPNGDRLIFTLTENLNHVDCYLTSGDIVYCSFNEVGIGTFTVRVSDGEFARTEQITIKIVDDTPANNPPYLNNLPSPLTYGITLERVDLFKLSDYAIDSDGDQLSYTLSGGNNIVDCNLLADTRIRCDLENIGTTTLTATVSDGQFTDSDTITITVVDDRPVNNAPYFSGLPNFFQYQIGQGDADVIDLAQYAFDPDGDALTFSVQENSGVLGCYIKDDSVLHCDFASVGTATVQVTVSDGQLQNTESITIKIVPDPVFNTAPYWDNLPFTYQENIEQGQATLVRLANFAKDNDGDSLSYLLDESNTNKNIVDCTINQYSDLICNLNSVGTTTVDVIVSDGELSDRQTLSIEVVKSNNAPQWIANIPTYFEYDLDLQSVEVMNIANYVFDVDGDQLSYSLDQSLTNRNVVDCSLSGSRLRCDLNGIGVTTLKILVTDGEYTIEQTITVKVFKNNQAPVWTIDPAFSYNIDESSVVVADLDNEAYDPDGDRLTFSLDESRTNRNIVDCNINSRNELFCVLWGVGTTELTLIASDGELQSEKTITISVYETNDAPYFQNLDSFYRYPLSLGQANVVKLSDFARDPNGDSLSFSLDESNTNRNIVDCRLDQYSNLICDLNGVGTTSLVAKVSDGEFTTSQTITIEVYDDNRPPYFDVNTPMYFEYDLALSWVKVLDIANYVTDPDGDYLTYTLDETNTNKNVVDCNLVGSMLDCDLIGVGTTTVDIVVSDGQHTVRKTITIRVFTSNVPPKWSVDLPKYFSYNIDLGSVEVLRLRNYAYDSNGDSLSFLIDQSNTNLNVVDCSIDAQSDLNCDLNGVGTTSVDVIVSDGEYSVRETITINVFETNDAPYFQNLESHYRYPLSLQVATLTKLSDFARDPNGDALSFYLDESSTNKNIVDCRLDQYTNLICDLFGVGQTTLQVIVSDGQLESRQTIHVEVYDDNRPPYFDVNIPMYFEYDIDLAWVKVLDIANYVTDPDGDHLTYSLDESNTNKNIIDCNLVGSMLDCDLIGIGTTTVDIVVSDGQHEIRKTITIRVFETNNGPNWNANFPDYFSYDIDLGDVDVLRLSNYASDPDGDALTFTIDQSGTNFNVIDCSLDTQTDLNCDLNGVGTTTVDVIVSDGKVIERETITINVYETNDAPYFKAFDKFYKYPLSAQVVTVIDLSSYAVDPNGDTLDYLLDESQTNNDVVDCYLNQYAELICVLNGVGTTSLQVGITDGEFTATETITIQVYDDNRPPYFDNNLQLYYEYDIDLVYADVVDLADFARDPDGDILFYSLDQSNTDNNILNCWFVDGTVLRCNFLGLGTTSLLATVSDGKQTDTVEITIRVIQDNTAPYFKHLTTEYWFNIEEGRVDVTKLSNHGRDPQNDPLTYTIDEAFTNFNIIDCDLETDTTVACDLNGVGTSELHVQVSDGEYTTNEVLIIHVYDPNHAPVWDANFPTQFTYDIDLQEVTVFKLSDHVTDPDNDQLNYGLDQSQTNKNIVDCRLDQYSNLICELNGLGTTKVVVSADDGEHTVKQTVYITVTQDNVPLQWSANLPTYFEYDLALDQVQVMDVANYVIDDNPQDLTYQIDQSNTNFNVLKCTMVGSVLDCDLRDVGITRVDIVVSDGEYTIRETITIKVYEINTPPYFDLNLPTYFEYGLSLQEVDVIKVSDYVFDAQNDQLSYSLDTSNTNTNVVSCTMRSDTTIHCDLNGVGTTTVDVIVSDGEFTVSQTLTIRVYDDKALAIIDGPTMAHFNEQVVFDGSRSSGSQNSNIVSYEWLVNENGQLFAGTGTSISHIFTTIGTHKVTLTVTDEFGVQDTATHFITIKAVGPIAIITADARTTLGTTYSFDGFKSYAQNGLQIISYYWRVFDGQNNVIATFSGPSQSIIFNEQDQYTLELTVTDSLGNQDTATFALQARYGQRAPKDFGPEEGLKIVNLELYGTNFEETTVEGELLIVAVIENTNEDDDFDNVRMTFTIPEVGYKEKSPAVELRAGDRKTIQIFTYLPDYVDEGHYYPIIEFSDTEVRRSKPMFLEVIE